MAIMPDDPFDPDECSRFEPAEPAAREELGGVLERAFAHEGGKDPNAEESRRLHTLADEALREAETKLSLAREAEAALDRAAERYGRSGDRADLDEVERWKESAEIYRRLEGEWRATAEMIRQRVV